MDRLPVEIQQRIDYWRWGKMSRIERISKLDLVIVDIYMQDKIKLDKRDMRIIGMLDRMRRSEVIKNWRKPKYDD